MRRRGVTAIVAVLAALAVLIGCALISSHVDSNTPDSASASPGLAVSPSLASPSGNAPASTGSNRAPSPSTTNAIPAGVWTVLAQVDASGGRTALPGYEGGRRFGNYEGLLPDADAHGRPIAYQEWDVEPLRPGRSRGPKRVVTGSDGSAYYTADHYVSFVPIRAPGGREGAGR